MTTHLLLVSKQAVPNLTPLLDTEIKPEKAVLLATKDMQKKAKWLELVLKKYSIKCQIESLDSAYNIQKIEDKILDLLANDESMILNATGGTKIMSIAAFGVFQSEDKPIYYVNVENDRVIWLNPKKQQHEIKGRIKLEDFLLAHGIKVKSLSREKPQDPELEVAEKIIERGEYYKKAIRTVNYYASKAKNTLKKQIESDRHITNEEKDLIEHFEQYVSSSIRPEQFITNQIIQKQLFIKCLTVVKSKKSSTTISG